MRDYLKSGGRWLSVGWFWPLVLLALPDCSTLAGADPWPRGPEPRTSAVMCDIPKPFTTECATATQAASNVSTTQAAVALVTGQSSVNNFALDFGSGACRDGLPMRTEFFGPYPDGFHVCLNCENQTPEPFPDGNAVCVAQCEELLASDGEPDPPQGFCAENARVSTNFDKTRCYDNACTRGGAPLAFNDPRRSAELVNWIVNPNDGTSASGNSLTRTANTGQDFNAGSAAEQVISKKGDGWVEFEVGDNPDETQLSHVLGVSTCNSPCSDGDPQDSDPSLADIEFAIFLNRDGKVYAFVNPDFFGPFGNDYAPGERFRVKFVDNNHDDMATISFQRSCTPNTACDGNEFFTSDTPATYPLRIDTSFREKDATLAKVTLVRIR